MHCSDFFIREIFLFLFVYKAAFTRAKYLIIVMFIDKGIKRTYRTIKGFTC